MNLVKIELPGIYNFTQQCYGQQTSLRFGEEIITLSEGVQQGDPLGPFLFSTGIQEDIVNKMESEFNCWYLDDGCLGGHPQTVINDLQKIKETYNSHGLQLNTAKCELFLVDSLYDEEDLNGRSSTSSSSNRRSSGFDPSANYSNFWSFPNSLDSSSLGSNIWSFPSASNEDIVKQFNDLYNGIRVIEKSKLSLLGAPIFTSAVQSRVH